MTERTLDLSDYAQKALLLDHVRSLQGEYRVTIVKKVKRRSGEQNAYYFGVIVDLFADWLRSQGHDVTDNDAHEMLKSRFLKKSLVDEKTGEIIGEYTDSTALQSTIEFSNYWERCAQWMAEFCGIVVPEPSPFYERKTK